MPPSRPLVLASGSSYRRALLARLGLPFTCDSPDIDESPRPDEKPEDLARRLATAKARHVAGRHRDALVIGSDQVADCDGTLLGKPGTQERAQAQLRAASGRTVTFWTALTLLDAASGRLQETVVPCDVDFRALTDDEIARYVALEMPLDCAGSFRAEGLGIVLFRRLRTDDPTSLVGLPLIALAGMLRAEGVTLPPADASGK